MQTPVKPRLKVIGVGNEWRGDDAVGLLVARCLKAAALTGVEIFETLGTTGAMQDAWKDAAGVIVVDALASIDPPGAIYRFDAHGAGVPVKLSHSPSSHGWGVAEALALGQVFQELPPWLIIYGIAGENFDPGRGVSPAVAAAIPELVRRIEREIQEWLGREPPQDHPPKTGEQPL
jgi:hydrogenase maturation protease